MNAQTNTQTKQNNSVVVGGRTYTHVSTDRRFLGRIICTDLAQETHTIVFAVLPVDSQWEGIAHCNKAMEDLYTRRVFEPITDVDWTQVEVDTQIYVSDYKDTGYRARHFAKYDPLTKIVYTWDMGRTSHTSLNYQYTGWNYATLTDPLEKTGPTT